MIKCNGILWRKRYICGWLSLPLSAESFLLAQDQYDYCNSKEFGLYPVLCLNPIVCLSTCRIAYLQKFQKIPFSRLAHQYSFLYNVKSNKVKGQQNDKPEKI